MHIERDTLLFYIKRIFYCGWISDLSGQNMPLPTDLKELYRSYQQEIHANSYNTDVNALPLTSTMQSIDKRYAAVVIDNIEFKQLFKIYIYNPLLKINVINSLMAVLRLRLTYTLSSERKRSGKISFSSHPLHSTPCHRGIGFIAASSLDRHS